MKTARISKAAARQSGVALLVALMALLILSAIGMGMMYSANTETMIAANYRDSQMASYAAVGGLQEGRDRLMYRNPSTADMLTRPTGLPSASAANIIYIINPDSGETVAPWDSSDSTFFDTELCHENVMGLTGTAGVPCPVDSTSVPSGSSWYTVLNNSASGYTGAYKLSPPLPYKWIRISLKADNMTLPAVNSSPTGAQVCWDGQNQIPLPTGYNTDCGPVRGAVGIAIVKNQGNGYTSTPSVSIAAPPSGGTQATATANVTYTPTDSVGTITVVTSGNNYTSAPTVTIDPPPTGGTQATAVATIVAPGQKVTNLDTFTAGSVCYGPGATISINWNVAGSPSASFTPVLSNNSCIYSISLSGSCSTAKNKSNVSYSLSGFSGFSGQADFSNGSGAVNNVRITAPGSGYTSAPAVGTAVSVSGYTCSGGNAITVGAVTMGNMVSNVSLVDGGSGYTSAPVGTLSTSAGGTGTAGGLGTPATFTTDVGGSNPLAGKLASITITYGGSGYTSAPNITLSGGSGSPQATATSSLAMTGKVTSITITNAGSGYTSAPTITLDAPPSGGVQATAATDLMNGTWYGQVFLVTSMARTKSGTRAMAQMEAVLPVRGFAGTGALTLDGPSPTFTPPNSLNMVVNGNDLNSCGGVTNSPHPAIGVYDDPNNPTSPTAQSTVTTAVNAAKPANYIGKAIAPDIENIYGGLGDTMSTVSGVDAFASAVLAVAQANGTYYTGDPTSVAMGSPGSPVVDYISGDSTKAFSGTSHGYGILMVSGNLEMGGNFSWDGIILVIGTGKAIFNGGGSGQINGTILAANTRDSSNALLSNLGSPSVTWTGGGGNGIRYDHCQVDNMLSLIPFTPPQSTRPLTVISTKTLTY